MKKLFMLVLGLSFMITLAACGDDGEVNLPEELEDMTPQEVADKLVNDFDGDLSHLEAAMDSMDLTEAYEMTIEGDVQMSMDGVTVSSSYSVTDKMVVVDGLTTYSRTQSMDVDGMSYTTEMIVEEVAGGVNVYFNVGELIDSLPYDVRGDIEDALAAFNLTEDWLFFHFEDSLENVVEVEAMKDFLLFILKDELGANAYDELQTELENEVGFDLNQYGVDIPAFGALLEDNDYDGLQGALEEVDFEGIQAEFGDELNNMIPGVNPLGIHDALRNVDQVAFRDELETFDFEVMLQNVALGEAGFDTYLNTIAGDYPEMKALLEEYVPFVAFLEENDALSEVGYVANNISTFDKYFELQTYIDEEVVNISVEAVNGTDVLTTMIVEPENFGTLFQELVTDVYWFAYQFPGSDVGYVEHINCPVQSCDEFDIYEEIEDELAGVDPIEMEFLFHPGADASMTFTVDGADFVESLAASQGEAVIAQNFGMSIMIKEGATIDVPAAYDDLKETATELIKMQMVQSLEWKLRDVYWQSEYNNFPVDTAIPVSELEWEIFSGAINSVTSTFTVHSDGDVSVDLYWRDGGAIFAEEISMNDLDALDDSFWGEPFSREQVEAYLAYINEDNFDLGKALVYMMLD